MKLVEKRSKLGSIFVLLVFCVFIFCVLLVLLLGAGVLKSVTARGDSSYENRVCAQYIAEKIRHFDEDGRVYISGFGGESDIQTLFLSDEIDGSEYLVRIYCYNGSIYELFTEADYAASPADGTPVAPARGLSFEIDGSLLSFECENADGSASKMSVCLRGGEATA